MVINTTSHSNFYDSILNEVEKLNLYEREFELFNDEEYQLVQSRKCSLDIVGFIYYKKQEILTDKYLRAFVNLLIALDRYFNTLIAEIQDIRTNEVIFYPKLLNHIKMTADRILTLCSYNKLYADGMNEKIMNQNVKGYFEKLRTELENLIAENDYDSIPMSTEDFLPIITGIKKELDRFSVRMRTEIESRNYYRDSKIIVCHMVELFLIVALTTMTISKR